MAVACADVVQLFFRPSWGKVVSPIIQGFQFCVRREVNIVLFLFFASAVNRGCGKAAGPVEIQVRVKKLLVKFVNLLSVSFRDMEIAHMLSDY